VSPPIVTRRMHPMLFSSSQYVEFGAERCVEGNGSEVRCNPHSGMELCGGDEVVLVALAIR
jgi:hypothetical protein